MYWQQDSNELEYHVCDWNSLKQRRVCYSSFGAEILAAADADDRTHAMRELIRSLFVGTPMKTITSACNVYRNGFFDTVTTLHDGRDYRIRDSFESRDFDALAWILGRDNVADALTKRNSKL